jgi:hypothetical protein
MGHRDIASTLNEYGHLVRDPNEALTERMDLVGRAARKRPETDRDMDQMWTTARNGIVAEGDFGVEKAA